MIELPDGPYKTIIADPPWPESGGGKVKRGADKHYGLMKVKDIEEMATAVREIPHLRLGASVRFDRAVVEQWIKEGCPAGKGNGGE